MESRMRIAEPAQKERKIDDNGELRERRTGGLKKD
jgi:hypothetical protein